MNFDGNFKELMTPDIDELVSRVEKITPEEWVEDDTRQKRFPDVASDVETIMLCFNGFKNNRPNARARWDETTVYPNWEKWEDVIQPVLDQVYPLFTNPFLNKCMIVKLRANGEIPAHYDGSETFDRSHRLHIPLITNPDCIMTIDGEPKNMEKGILYEVNNKREHDVENKGNDDRIHLLFDIYEQKDK